MQRQPTLHHITWFIDMDNSGQLDLDPPYQRKSVWNTKDKRFFLDTIFRNYPAPPIFIHRDIDDSGKATYHVVDGKQRLNTILGFANGKIAIDKSFGDENLNGKKFSDLSTEYKRKFWNYVMVVDFIDNIEGNNINEVFDRVNRNAKNLQPQELRHARYDGWFIEEAEQESEDSFWALVKVSTKAKDKRMKSVQTVSELLCIILDEKIVGFSQDYLDKMYAQYDILEEIEESFDPEEYQSKKGRVKAYLLAMNEANQSVENYCKTANNLYTLWALIALTPESQLPAPAELANRYAAFMTTVEQFAGANTEGFTPTAENSHQFDYFINSKGASTEEPQRLNRLAALRTIVS